MAREGLGDRWECLFANDNSELKLETYRKRWGDQHCDPRDVQLVTSEDLPRHAHMLWASFPCQDLSVAGTGRGIGASNEQRTRSGALWSVFRLLEQLKSEKRLPPLVTLENVPGLLASNSGNDFCSICESLADLDYFFGAVHIDAKYFVPQSRPRVFIVAYSGNLQQTTPLVLPGPQAPWHPPSLVRAAERIPMQHQSRWRWWDLGAPPEKRKADLAELVTADGNVVWNSSEETDRIISMMSEIQLGRLKEVQDRGQPTVGSLYFRMRPLGKANIQLGKASIQRAEVAFGETLGCLRTPRGGASRPRIIYVSGKDVKTRLLSIAEARTLMGLQPDYPMPEHYQQAFHVLGDGVVPEVISFLENRVLRPLAMASQATLVSHSAEC